MDDKAKIELEKEKKDAISFEAYKAALNQRKGVIVGVAGIKSLVDSSGIRNILADFGKTVYGMPLGSDYHIICADENIYEDEMGLFLEGDALVVKTDLYGETQYITKEDLDIIGFLFERRTVFLSDDHGNSFPAIELARRAA